MPVYRLTEDLIFPHPKLANPDGLLALGGDLSAERLVLAYSNGIFPWFSGEEPILWWSPDPRCIIAPGEVHVSRSLAKELKKQLFKVTFDVAFEKVISMCRMLREGETWITDGMTEAYCSLHKLGLAHSVEVWYGDKLAGGLYGVSLGRCFFGESMFSLMDNASKTALVTLSDKLKNKGFFMLDCQVYSRHLQSMGAVNIPRSKFLELLREGLKYETLKGSWTGI